MPEHGYAQHPGGSRFRAGVSRMPHAVTGAHRTLPEELLNRANLTRPLQPPTALHTSPLPGATHLFLDGPLEHVLERLGMEICRITLPGARECLPSAYPG